MSSFSGPRGAAITGTGAALPSRLVTNTDLESLVGADTASHAIERFGVAQRYWCGADESTADLAEEAARAALTAAGVEPHQVGLLIIATDTPEFVAPSTAAVVHGRLELDDAHAYDMSAGGADFLTALGAACHAIRADATLAHAVVVGVSAMSKYLDPHDARTVPVFGDGAAAVVVSATSDDGVSNPVARTWGRHSHDVGVFAGGTRTPITPVVIDAGLQNRLRVLREFPEALPAAWAELVQTALATAQLDASEVTHWFWAHPSQRAVRDCATVLRMSQSNELTTYTNTLFESGYTGAAMLPMMLDRAVRAGTLSSGDVLLLTAAGAGVSAAATTLRWYGAHAG